MAISKENKAIAKKVPMKKAPVKKAPKSAPLPSAHGKRARATEAPKSATREPAGAWHPGLRVEQTRRAFWLLTLPARTLVHIAYASVRGEANEEGAVQRLLSPRRIASLRDFALEGGTYPSCVVVNWVGDTLKVDDGRLWIPYEDRTAQIIDGQHRIAGLREAIKVDAKIGDLEIPVSLYEKLNTRECADIFLSINTEQKPVPRSLVFDLYGVASEYIVDPAAQRAKDLAQELNETDDSPYFGYIKFPGAPRMRGGIALSTAVSALKPIIDDKGPLEQVGVIGLESQTRAVLNFFEALRDKYGSSWSNKENAFLYAAGFMGALEFFRTHLVPYCAIKKSFKKKLILDALDIDRSNLILRAEVKGLGGKEATLRISDRLRDAFTTTAAEQTIEL